MDASAGRSRPVDRLVGIRARRILSPGSRGQVLAGPSRVRYLLSSRGELTWLAPRDVPMHRRAVRLAVFDPCPISDTAYRVTDSAWLVSQGFELDLRMAPTWDPPRLASGRQAPARAEWHRHLAQALLRLLPEPRGYGALLPSILDPSSGAPGEAASAPPYSSVPGFGAAQRVASACRHRDLALVLTHAAELVGRGEGLTPSGDDFLGGILFGFASLGWDADDPAAVLPTRLSSFLDWSKPRTNVISHALLRDYAAGEGPEVLERFTAYLLEKRPLPAMLNAAAGLARLGHTTGWSLLSGAWTALALVPCDEARAPARRATATAWC